MDKLGRLVLKLLEAVEGKPLPQKQIAERLGRATDGGSWITLTTAAKEQLAARGFVEIDPKAGVRARVRARIGEDLTTYQATDADVEAAYQNVVHAIATEGE